MKLTLFTLQLLFAFISANEPIEMGEYQKSKTQFDGITVEEFVTYLKLDSISSV